MALQHHHENARGLQIDFQQATVVRISDQTVRNRLHEENLTSRRPARGPILTEQHHSDLILHGTNRIGSCATVVLYSPQTSHTFTYPRAIDM